MLRSLLITLLCSACGEGYAPTDPGHTGYLTEAGYEPGVDPAAAPDYQALFADGRLQVVAVFGQIERGPLRSEDAAWWSLSMLEAALREAGFEGESPLTRSRDGLEVSVRLVGPEAFRLDDSPSERARAIAHLIRPHEVVYFDGHALLHGWGALGEASNHDSRYRIMALDLCWSWSLYTRPILDAAPNTHVVNARNRVVTGSVDSFIALLAHLIEGRAPWRPILRDMNTLAEARADARRSDVGPELRPPEAYGVSGL